MPPDFAAFLDHLRSGLSEEDAAALVGLLPDELDGWLAGVPDAKRQVLRAQAEFRARMTRVLVEAAEVNRSVTAAKHYLTRPARERQLKLDFTPADNVTVTLDLPPNER